MQCFLSHLCRVRCYLLGKQAIYRETCLSNINFVNDIVTIIFVNDVLNVVTYQSAMNQDDKQNARIEHDKALERLIVEMLTDHTVLFKQFMDNQSFNKWLADTIFNETHKNKAV